MGWLWRFRRKPPQVTSFYLVSRNGTRLVDLTPDHAQMLSAFEGKKDLEIRLECPATLFVKVKP